MLRATVAGFEGTSSSRSCSWRLQAIFVMLSLRDGATAHRGERCLEGVVELPELVAKGERFGDASVSAVLESALIEVAWMYCDQLTHYARAAAWCW